MIKLFVGGLRPDVSEMDIAMLIGLYCNIETVKVVRDRATHKCKGYAFVETSKVDDAQKVISALNGESFKGNTLTIKISEEEAPKAPKFPKYTTRKPIR
ncbi:RNA recognition motif domain-containing protein [Pedobacter jejuensis]|uniref:RNA-binding protein n=1 Tax=Pedobacter jejuensis TaxID=1268550 RepID=A0A3N0C1N4_9SPHI|nr:RNA-binding protein [Pedobacter jejuensis]RNL56121.1 RNA-binding protein [Pedobacter jejuensis]